MFKKINFSLPFIAFLQAVGLVFYCGLVGLIFWQGNNLFGPPFGFWGPALMLSLLVVSVLICGLVGLGYPFHLFWIEKKPAEGLRLVVYTAAWLTLIVFLLLIILTLLL